MSDRPIQVGDLVQVIKPLFCCGDTSHCGRIFKVIVFNTDLADTACQLCGGTANPTANALFSGATIGYDVRRLKRIPPLSELEGERTEENLKEPA